ncbi:transporter substrate-binding domain-containing protein [Pseudomonas alkylphenolica]|uniref:transporter substrate-binding domain-containing protein n=1 Tax=Pseudomonas alkylphenolica TaxID=237609 RepID=UPI0018D5D338|nr:transporter substrate-binding domain-containing protein [Pseudomonas alkylphenolica]MBH3430869.1 transporter substrate-binding domain-containing protein [Pseudomonas alkylphenolica]
MRLTIGVLLAALLSPWAHAELIDDMNDRGELRIAVEANMPPFNFKDNDSLTGFEIELGRMLAEELDVRAEFIVTTRDDLLPGVETGKYDIALDQVAATPELKQRLDFSEPYSDSSAQLIASKSHSLGVLQNSLQPVTEGATNGANPSLTIPFQKGNPAFHSAVDKALQRIKADGRLESLSQKWFGMDASEPPKK